MIIYQGEELGLPQAQIAFERLKDPQAIANWPFTLGRDGARTPMPWHSDAAPHTSSWLPLVDEHLALAVALQERDAESQLAFTRRVLAMRSRHDALVHGALDVIEAADPLLAFTRTTPEQQVLCVFNLGHGERHWQRISQHAWNIIERSSAGNG